MNNWVITRIIHGTVNLSSTFIVTSKSDDTEKQWKYKQLYPEYLKNSQENLLHRQEMK